MGLWAEVHKMLSFMLATSILKAMIVLKWIDSSVFIQ